MLTAEQKKLVEDNERLIYFALNKYHYPIDEYYDLAAISLCKAAEKFDPARGGAFSSYAMQSMWNELSHFNRVDSHYLRPKISIDAPLPEGGTIADVISSDFCLEDIDENIFANDCIDKAKVKDRYKEIFNEWIHGKTLRQIAKEHGYTVQWAQNITSKVRKACIKAAKL